MKSITMLRNTIVGPGVDALAGETVAVDVDTANRLVKTGRAVFADGSVPVDGGIITKNGDPMLDHAPTKKLKTR